MPSHLLSPSSWNQPQLTMLKCVSIPQMQMEKRGTRREEVSWRSYEWGWTDVSSVEVFSEAWCTAGIHKPLKEWLCLWCLCWTGVSCISYLRCSNAWSNFLSLTFIVATRFLSLFLLLASSACISGGRDSLARGEGEEKNWGFTNWEMSLYRKA